jgi:hypothetical protein
MESAGGRSRPDGTPAQGRREVEKMSEFSVRCDPEEGIIRVEMHGEFDAETLSASTAALAGEIKRSGCTRVLLDHRQAAPTLSVIQQYMRPEVAAKLGVPRSCRIAIVYRGPYDTYRFIETVARNKGLAVRIFKIEDEALEWLREPARQA